MKRIQTDLRAAFEDKIRRGIFNPIARLLPEDVREDRLQDAVAQTWAMYERHAKCGELLDDAILVHSCGQRATDASRYYVHCDGYQRKRNVLDPRNYMEGTVEMLRLDRLHEDEEDDGEGHQTGRRDKPASIGFAELRCPSPLRKIHSARDLTAWLVELAAEDRRMLELRAAGYTLEETAAKLGMSLTAVFHACRRLGLALAERAGMPVEPRKHKGRSDETRSATTRRARRASDTPATTTSGPRKMSPRPEAARCAA